MKTSFHSHFMNIKKVPLLYRGNCFSYSTAFIFSKIHYYKNKTQKNIATKIAMGTAMSWHRWMAGKTILHNPATLVKQV